MTWFFALVALVLAAGNFFRVRANAESSLRTWAKNNGYKVVSLSVVRHAVTTRYRKTPGEAQVVMSRFDLDTEIPGRMSWRAGFIDVVKIEFIPFRAISSAERREHSADANLDEDRLATLYIEDDFEAQVLSEVNRRLDGITTQTNWMKPYDLDGSGHIDEEEWSILRGSIMADVRGELGDPRVQAVLTPAPGVEPVKRLPAPLVQEDDEDDAHW